jgi:hypothetical protein
VNRFGFGRLIVLFQFPGHIRSRWKQRQPCIEGRPFPAVHRSSCGGCCIFSAPESKSSLFPNRDSMSITILGRSMPPVASLCSSDLCFDTLHLSLSFVFSWRAARDSATDRIGQHEFRPDLPEESTSPAHDRQHIRRSRWCVVTVAGHKIVPVSAPSSSRDASICRLSVRK